MEVSFTWNVPSTGEIKCQLLLLSFNEPFKFTRCFHTAIKTNCIMSTEWNMSTTLTLRLSSNINDTWTCFFLLIIHFICHVLSEDDSIRIKWLVVTVVLGWVFCFVFVSYITAKMFTAVQLFHTSLWERFNRVQLVRSYDRCLLQPLTPIDFVKTDTCIRNW